MAMRNPRTKFRKMWEHQWKTSISKGFSKAMSTCQRLVPNIFNFMRMSRSDTLIHPLHSNHPWNSLAPLAAPEFHAPWKSDKMFSAKVAMQNVNRVPTGFPAQSEDLPFFPACPTLVKTFHVVFLLEILDGKLLMQCAWENWGLPHCPFGVLQSVWAKSL